MRTASTPQANAKPHTVTLQFSTSPEDQALFASFTASSDKACRSPLGNQALYLLRMVFGQSPIDLPNAGLDEWPGSTARRKEGYGRVLRLVPKASTGGLNDGRQAT